MKYAENEDLFFRFKEMGDRYLITNDFGRYQFLDQAEFWQLANQQDASPEKLERLRRDMFLLSESSIPRAAEAYRKRKEFLRFGPFLHMLVVTLRCNTTCAYCQVSRAPLTATETDMSIPTAKATIDRIFESTSPFISIEFQGGEPLVNWETIKFCIEYAREKNKAIGKTLNFSIVSTLSLLTDEMIDVLVAPDINICTSVDGLEIIHNQNRRLPKSNAYHKTVEMIKVVNARYRELGYDPYLFKVQALLTTTRYCFDHYKAIIDNYLELGMHVIHLRPLQPFGFALGSWRRIGYSSEEFLDFYRKSVEYLLELNKQGVEILEKTANLVLMKLFSDFDPNFVDLRNPSGDAIGGLAYNYDGNVFVSDEGRMIYEMNREEADDSFLIGNVHEHNLEQILNHPTVRSCIVASTLDNQPECSQCAYNPYCGICPTYNYVEQNDIFGQNMTNERCKKLKGIFGYLFSLIEENDPEVMAILHRWGSWRAPDEEAQPKKAASA